MYQAIASAGRRVRGALELLTAIALPAAGCAETTPALGGADVALQSKPPLAHITYTSRHSRSLDLDDRLPLFDRVDLSWPSAILYDREHDVY